IELAFDVEGGLEPLRVYTTRPDTLYGVTFMAVAAGHPLARHFAGHDADLREFIAECERSGVTEAAIETMDKRGMPLGVHALHPLTGERIPVWVANFVLTGYGTGAVMGVPAHDDRDFEFAQKYSLPIHQVIAPVSHSQPQAEPASKIHDESVDMRQAFTEHGVLINSGEWGGKLSEEAMSEMSLY